MCCEAYYKLASIYVLLYEYKYGLRCYKLMLKYAWIANNKDLELTAYEGIAHCYYYLEDLKKSSYYHSRVMKGTIESESSSVRSYSVKRYNNNFHNPSV